MIPSVLREDLERVAASQIPLDLYRGRSFLVTGATGLIGSLLTRTLLYLNETRGLQLHVTAVVRNAEKARGIYGEALDDPALSLLVWDVTRPLPPEDRPAGTDYIIHAAAVTTSRDMVKYPADNILVSFCGTQHLLELARDTGAKSMIYVSSMEVYGAMPEDAGRVTEDMLGYVDLTAARSCYPEGKRICECLCSAFAHQYGLHVTTVRLAQTFGAGILPGENRVFAQFARSVLSGSDIVLHTRGQSEGNYVYASDAAAAILLLLTEGESGAAYNVANEASHMRICDMAELVADEVAGGRIRVVYDIPEDLESMGYAPDTRLFLSSEKLRDLGWAPQIGMTEAYLRMLQWMQSPDFRTAPQRGHAPQKGETPS